MRKAAQGIAAKEGGKATERQTGGNTLRNSALIFILCLAVHAFEVLVIRTDETVFAECFINKVFGILLLCALLRRLRWRWSDIGFTRRGLLPGLLKGFLLCLAFYAMAFAAEFAALSLRGTPARMELFVTGFSLTGNPVKQTGLGAVLMCVGFNIINVWMEEGLFRGFYITYISTEHGEKTAMYAAALLFGLWHLVLPLRSLLDGEMGIAAFAAMGVGYIILSAVMGVKWGLLYRASGTVWIGLADHLFNNCVVTNLLHVATVNGVDELQIARVLMGELTSFAAVLIYMRVKGRAGIEGRKAETEKILREETSHE